MKYIILESDERNGYSNGVSIFNASPILSGKYIGKFATSENALKEFPDLFPENPLIVDLPNEAFQVDFTPPSKIPYAIEIPEKYQWLFPINLNGFVIPMDDYEGKMIVNAAYLQWEAFTTEADKPENSAFKTALEQVWDWAKIQTPIEIEL